MSVTLESLVGAHSLSGVDMVQESVVPYVGADYSENASICRFRLDRVVYTCTEDPSDGYRSSMKDLVVGGKVVNRFAPQKVLCYMRTSSEGYCKDELLVMRDVVTGKEVLVIGTHNTDDYYPSFVANFQPENMACNRDKK